MDLFKKYSHLMWDGEEKLPLIVSFGAGVDSTAILVEMRNRGIRPDYIIFSDTGAERPDIYAHIERVNKWLKKVGFPEVSVTSRMRDGSPYYLKEQLDEYQDIPSLAYGFKTCSINSKILPVNKFVKSQGIDRHIQVIGYGVGEIDRALKGLVSAEKTYKSKKMQKTKDKLRILWFPLIDWGLSREDCIKISREVGFCTSKSSCYFCPAQRLSEILKLRKAYPDLYEEAIRLEDQFLIADEKKQLSLRRIAEDVFGEKWELVDKEEFTEAGLTKPQLERVTKGLGRNWSWREKVAQYDNLPPKLPFMDAEPEVDMGCGCTDF